MKLSKDFTSMRAIHNATYYTKHKEEILAQKRKHYRECLEAREAVLERSKKRRIENPEYIKHWHKNHPDKVAEYGKNQRENNSVGYKKSQKKYSKTEKGKASKQRDNIKRQIKEGEIINTLTSNEWIDILEEYEFKCAYCGRKFNLFVKPTKDHIIPISRGGNNTKDNVVPACQSCNSKKHNKILTEAEVCFL